MKYVPNIPSIKTKTETRARFLKKVAFAYGKKGIKPQKKKRKKPCEYMKLASLAGRKNIARVFRSGKRIQYDCFTLFVIKNSLFHPRFAFIAPIAFDKRAVVRNRVRRRAREYVRKHAELSDMPYDVIFLFKKHAVMQTKKHFYECVGKAVSAMLS